METFEIPDNSAFSFISPDDMENPEDEYTLVSIAEDVSPSTADVRKLYILEDGTSDVPGFGTLGDDFINDFIKAGGNITTTDKILF